MVKAVITDVDGTLCDYIGISWVRFLGANKLIKKEFFDDHETLVEAYQTGLLDHVEFTKEWVKLYGNMIKGKSVAGLEKMSKKFCTAFNKSIPKHSKMLIKHFKKKKYKVIAITASPSIPARDIMKYMGIETYYATEPEVRNGRFTGEIETQMHLSEKGKQGIVREVIMKYGVETSKSFALGDTIHDLPLLESVAYPIAINPKGKLTEYAKMNGFWIADYSNILDVVDDAEASKSKSVFEQMKFLYEIGQLKCLPRTGWFHIHVKHPERISDHILRSSIISYMLALEENADASKCMLAAVMHDIGETRLGDINKISAKYLPDKNVGEEAAFNDAIERLGDAAKKDFKNAYKKYNSKKIVEILKDADMLENLMTAREYEFNGHVHAREWINRIIPNLKTRTAKKWAHALQKMDPNSWWFGIKSLKIR